MRSSLISKKLAEAIEAESVASDDEFPLGAQVRVVADTTLEKTLARYIGEVGVIAGRIGRGRMLDVRIAHDNVPFYPVEVKVIP